MILTTIKCNGCGKKHTGKYGEKAHVLRHRLAREHGWRQCNNRCRRDPNGKYDLCGECVKKVRPIDTSTWEAR